MRPLAGLLELWRLEVLTHRNHGETGSKEKGLGVGLEEWGGEVMGSLGGREAWWSIEGSHFSLKGERTLVRTAAGNGAPRSLTALTSAGVQGIQAPPEWRTVRREACESGAAPGAMALFAPRAEPLRSVCFSLLCPITEGPSWP